MSDSVGSVSVDVVPDARGWSEKLRAQIGDYTAEVKVKADTAEADAELDEVAHDRTSHVKVEVDKSRISEGANALDSFIGNLGLLPSLAITAGAALAPLAATLGGVAAALAAPVAIAGGGATLFAFLGGLAAKDTLAQLKAIDKLQAHLATLTKGTAAYTQAEHELKDAQKALTPEQLKFATALDGLKGAFQHFIEGKGGQSLLSVMAQGMTLLAHVLPLATPLIVSVGRSISSLLGDLSKASQTQGFHRFIDEIARLAGRDLLIGGHIIGDLAKGIGSLLTQTDKGFSGGFLTGVEHLTKNFADWANSKSARQDMRDFFGYVHDVGPQVAHTIGALARALGKVVEALAPLGPVVLKGIELAANSLAAIPVPVLTSLAAAVVGLTAFQKVGGFKGLGALGGALSGAKTGGVKGPLGGLLTGGVQKVYVVNMGEGGLGGGLGKTAEAESKYLPYLAVLPEIATLIGAGIGVYLITKHIALPNIHDWERATAPGDTQYGGDPRGRNGPHLPSLPAMQSSGHNPSKGEYVFNPVTKGYDWVAYAHRAATALDAIQASGARASRSIDLIGPHADNAFGKARGDVAAFQAKLAQIHDVKFAVIAQTDAAIRALQRIQAERIDNKYFTVYQRSQMLDRAVGPGGGAGQNPHGSAGAGGGSGAGAGAGRTPVQLHLTPDGRNSLNAYIQGNYDANSEFQRSHG